MLEYFFSFFSYDVIISWQIIVKSPIILAKCFPFSQIHLLGFQTYSFLHTWIFLHSHQHLFLFHNWFELHFLPSNLLLYSPEICFVNVYYPFIPVITLKTLEFKSSVLSGIHTLLDIKTSNTSIYFNCKWIVVKFLIIFIRV